MRRWPGLMLLFACSVGAQPFDVLIQGGRVVDGTGNPWRLADVGVRGGRIAAVGNLRGQPATRIVDAAGLVVAPGFIDIHNHSDDTVLQDGNAESMIRQGVTTMIFGEGGSAAPSKEFPDFGSYFTRVEKSGISTNIGTYVGSSQIWTEVRGARAGPPTPAELSAMQEHVRKAMQQGAFGVASSLSGPPGAWIDTATLIAMCKAAGEYGGIYSTHMRTEGQGVFEAVSEALEIGRKAGVPVDIIHLKLADRKLWGRMPELVSLIRQARDNGQQVEANVYPYRAGQNNLSSIVPPWAQEGGREAMLKRLADPALRDRLRNEIRNGIPGTNWYNHYTATGSWEGMLLVSLSHPEYKKFAGRRMSEVITALGGDDVDVLFKVLTDNKGSVPTVYFHHSEEDMRHALAQPFVSVGSDGTAVKSTGPLAATHPHPRYYGTFPRVLGRYVREDKVLTLEEAIRKMTSANATKLGIQDRGILRPGMWADVTVFDPARVIDNATYEKPHQYAAGINYVLVNGQLVLAQGEHTNARPGQVLRHSGPAAADDRAAAVDERATAEWILRSGGTVTLAGSSQIRELTDLPKGPVTLSGVDLVGTIIDPPELKRLAGLRELRELFLPGPIFNPGAGSRLDINDQLVALAGLTKLEKLHFSLHFLTNVNVQDKGLAHLKGLTELKELRLTQSRIKGSSLAPFTKLRKLELSYSTFADEGMQYLAGMKDLEYLALRDTLVSDEGLKHLAALANLEALDLSGTRVSDAGVRHLTGLKKLRKLNLLGASVTDESAQVLAGLPLLEEVNLYRTLVTNAGLAALGGLKNLTSLDIRYSRASAAGVAELKRSRPQMHIEFQDSAPVTARAFDPAVSLKPGTRTLDLARSGVSDQHLKQIAATAGLEVLRLDHTEITDAGLAALSGATSLRELNLSHTAITGKALAALPAVERLSLSNCEIGDEGVEHLVKNPRLQQLDLSYTDISDRALGTLRKLPALVHLDLTATEAADEGLASLAGLPALRSLRLSYTRITDTGFPALKGLPLHALEAARTRITDASAPVIAGMSALRTLNLDYTNVTDKLVEAIASLPLESLRLDTATVTDSSVPVLARMKTLKELNLYHTLVSEDGYNKLKAALPECRITWDRESALPTRRRS
ncbi:MAG TPA: amidohydrolase family protein [Bryobacteraceae bacterium]|nr:amidohydrolase family protein [Bryobacteraceae bacterium]